MSRFRWQASLGETSPKSEATCQQAGVRRLAPKAPLLSSRCEGVSSLKYEQLPPRRGRPDLMVEHDFPEFESSSGKPGVVSSSELVELHVIPAEDTVSSGEPDVTLSSKNATTRPKTSGGVPRCAAASKGLHGHDRAGLEGRAPRAFRPAKARTRHPECCIRVEGRNPHELPPPSRHSDHSTWVVLPTVRS